MIRIPEALVKALHALDSEVGADEKEVDHRSAAAVCIIGHVAFPDAGGSGVVGVLPAGGHKLEAYRSG